jgi:hypothetical protein
MESHVELVEEMGGHRYPPRSVATIARVGSNLTKHLTLWVTYHHSTQEGWDLTNVYLQKFEQDHTQESIISTLLEYIHNIPLFKAHAFLAIPKI